MAVLLYHTFVFFILFSYGIYHLVSATRSFFKPSSTFSSSSRAAAATATASAGDYIARPFYPLPLHHHLLRDFPLYLALLSLLISIAHHALISSASPHPFSSLQSAASLLFFLLLASSLLLPFPLPPDLLFFLAAVAFALLSSVSSPYHLSDLQSKCDSLSSAVSVASSALSLSLAVHPRLFLSELALSASLSLQGLWAMQTGLSLYVEGFIPEGCHRLLGVANGSTRCELEDSRIRAAALLDLAFVLHVTFVSIVAVVVYAAVAWASGGGLPRRNNGGLYESLPTSSSSGGLSDLDHIQMKAISKNSMQA